MKGNNIKLKNRYYIFISFVVAFCLIGSIFSVSFAYVSGNFKSSDKEIDNPYLNIEFYNGSTKINADGITGTISNTGAVTFKVNGSTVSASSLTVSIKNTGNITAEVADLYASLDFSDDNASNSKSIDSYYLTLNSNYVIKYNSLYKLSDVSVSANGSLQILNSISVASDIASSNLCGKTFTLHFVVSVTQEGYDDIAV